MGASSSSSASLYCPGSDRTGDGRSLCWGRSPDPWMPGGENSSPPSRRQRDQKSRPTWAEHFTPDEGNGCLVISRADIMASLSEARPSYPQAKLAVLYGLIDAKGQGWATQVSGLRRPATQLSELCGGGARGLHRCPPSWQS